MTDAHQPVLLILAIFVLVLDSLARFIVEMELLLLLRLVMIKIQIQQMGVIIVLSSLGSHVQDPHQSANQLVETVC